MRLPLRALMFLRFTSNALMAKGWHKSTAFFMQAGGLHVRHYKQKYF